MRKQRADRLKQEQREQQLANRSDPRPQLNCPPSDAPWLPVMDAVLETIRQATPTRRIKRSTNKLAAFPCRIVVPRTSAFSEKIDDDDSNLPTPEQWAIVPMTKIELAEEIERFIDFVDKNGRSVHLPMPFVEHFLKRDDDLPIIAAIATLPIVLADGAVLAKEFGGFDAERGIHFIIPREVLNLLPRREDSDTEAVRRAMQFLCDEWLVDVATGYVGKAIVIAAALTIIERSLLPDRPVFFFTSGRRGSGKTTLIKMLIMAVTGTQAAAAAWSPNEEERRKALLSYFLYGVPYVLWDNLKRGSQISCPHIEKSCTINFYMDRKLGVSEMVATAASSIHLFTGNNINPAGDLGSRSLHVRFTVDRPDPENRAFTHPDPVAWTENNRAEILQALFTILLGNPSLDLPRNAPMKTRFELWQRLVGSAVEYAAKLHADSIDPAAYEDSDRPTAIDFAALFRSMDEEDEEETSLGAVLEIMSDLWPDEGEFTAQDLCNIINNKNSDVTLEDADRAYLYTFFARKQGEDFSSKSVGRKLKQHVDEPVRSDDWTVILRASKDPRGGGKGGKLYKVKAMKT